MTIKNSSENGIVDIGLLSEALDVTPEVAQAVADITAAKSGAENE